MGMRRESWEGGTKSSEASGALGARGGAYLKSSIATYELRLSPGATVCREEKPEGSHTLH